MRINISHLGNEIYWVCRLWLIHLAPCAIGVDWHRRVKISIRSMLLCQNLERKTNLPRCVRRWLCIHSVKTVNVDDWFQHLMDAPGTYVFLDTKLLREMTNWLHGHASGSGTTYCFVGHWSWCRGLRTVVDAYGCARRPATLTWSTSGLYSLQVTSRIVSAEFYHTHPEAMQRVVYLTHIWPAMPVTDYVAALRILKHLTALKYRRLIFRSGLWQPGDVTVSTWILIYSDHDEALRSTDRDTYSGIVLYLNGDIIAWITHETPVVAPSSTAIEYIAPRNDCKDGLRLRYFIGEIGISVNMHMCNQILSWYWSYAIM